MSPHMLFSIGPFEQKTPLEAYRTLLHSCDCYAWYKHLEPTAFGEQTPYIAGKYFGTEFTCFLDKIATQNGKSVDMLCINPGPAQLPNLENQLRAQARQSPFYLGNKTDAEIIPYTPLVPQLQDEQVG